MSRPQTVIDVTYDDPRTGERVRERKIQEVSWNEVDDIRNRELALVAPRDRDYDRDRDRGYDDREYRRERSADDRISYQRDRVERTRYPPDYDRALARRAQDGYGGQVARRRDDRYKDYDDDDGDSDSSLDRRRRRRGRDHDRRNDRRARSEQPRDGSEGRLWYSMKDRRDGNFLERHFDSSYDGILAAATGAALAAVTVRRFDPGPDDRNKTLKVAAAAVVGAAVFNMAENHYRLYTEEREERKEREEERR